MYPSTRWVVSPSSTKNAPNTHAASDQWKRRTNGSQTVTVASRVAWGFVGTRHARFRDWVRGPRAIRTYLRERIAGTSRRRLGHNPAAGAMMLGLLAGVAAVGVTGWMQTLDAFWGAEWLEDLHEVLAWSLLGLIGLHVLAALVESWHYRENLVAAMIHGRKRAPDADDEPPA
jgi:cytochrome b